MRITIANILFGLLTGILSIFLLPCYAQVNYTANDIVIPYQGDFLFGVNPGAYQNDEWKPWTDEELAELAIGHPGKGIPGAGCQTWRPSLPDWFLEHFGYHIRDDAFDYYDELGMKDLTLFLNHPSVEHTDPATFCPDLPKTVFANLYQPIWDGGQNGTPYNDNNYYAAYIYQVVERYGDHIKFYEVWNEPDFSSTANAQSPSGTPNSWWDKDPDPCDLLWFNAPVQYYVRMLRITYDIIKTLDPDAYVCVGGLGYPSFLDAIMRNTDNPNGGGVSAEYPLQGGAYFDVCSFHYYPHVSSAFQEWNVDIQDWNYFRHTDAGIDAFEERFNLFKGVCEKYGYNGSTYPEKEFICTETNMPRYSFNNLFGGDQVQVNYAIKLAVFSHQNKIRNVHLFHLGETRNDGEIWQNSDLFFFMGLYENLMGANQSTAKRTDLAIGYKTASDLMEGYWFDSSETALLNLGSNIRGGAFKNSEGDYLYVLWATTHTDRSENSQAQFSFPSTVAWTADASATLTKKEWNYSLTNQSTTIGHQNVSLTGTPIFLSISPDITDCNGLSLNINSNSVTCSGSNDGTISVFPINGTSPYTYAWNTGQNSSLINGLTSGLYTVTVQDFKGCEVIQSIQINEPFGLNLTISINNETEADLSDGSATAFAGGGTPPYTYQWSNGVTGPYVNNLSPGDYSITLTDANNCWTSRNINIAPGVAVGCNAFGLIVDQNNVSCTGMHDGSVFLNPTDGTPPYVFAWNTGQNTSSLQFLPKGTYTVSITDAEFCEIIRDFTIEEPTPLDLFLIGNNLTSADSDDGSIISIPAGGVPPYSILWSNGLTNFTLENLPAGVYEVTLTDSNGCQITDEILINTPYEGCENFTSDITLVNNSCFGMSNGFAAANPQGGVAPYSYIWSTGETSTSISNLPSGNYKVTISDALDCSIERAFNINSPDPLGITFNVENTTDDASNDGFVNVAITGGTVPYFYEWSNGGTQSFLSNLSPGFYSVTITDSNGCQLSEEIDIFSNENDCDDFNVTASTLDVTCAGGRDGVIVLIPQQGQGPFSYVWETGETSPDLTNIGTGVYSATVTDNNGCEFHISETITSPAPISINFESLLVGNCAEAANVRALVQGGTPPYNYFWSNGSTDFEILNVTSGEYRLTIIDSKGCVNEGQISIQLDNLILQLESQVTNVKCFGEENGAIDIEVINGAPPFQFEWSNGATTEDLFDLPSDTYFVTVTDSDGCRSIYNYGVNSPPELNLDFIVEQPSLNGSPTGNVFTIIDGGSPPYQFLWDIGIKTQDLSNLLPGEYSLTVTDVMGCVRIKTVIVEFPTSTLTVKEKVSVEIFPNPGNGKLFLSVNGDELLAEACTLIDITGKVVHDESLNGNVLNHELNFDKNPPGTYLLKIRFSDGSIYSKKYVLIP